MAEVQKHPMIYGAIANVIADVGSVKKDKVNKVQNFKFRSVDDVFNAIHPALAKNKVFIVPLVIDQNRTVEETKNGTKMHRVILKIKFTFYAEDGSHVESIIPGEALDTGDKATNKAMAIAYKYACFQVFAIPTEDMIDPDSERPELDQNSSAASEQPKANKTTQESKKESKAKEEKTADTEKITSVMIETIKAEMARTGVQDKQFLSMKEIKAKKIDDMTIDEFNRVMKKFEKTPDLKKGDTNE